MLTGKAGDNYKFKTPTLRNVALTGPWTHSGSVQTLEDVILLHAQPVLFCETYRKNPKNFFYTEFYENFVSTIDADTDRFASRMNSVSPELNQLGLSQSEVQDLVLFLKSLTDKKFLSRAKAPTGDEL